VYCHGRDSYDYYDDMGILSRVSCWISTLGPVGYLPAPGTWGTLCALFVMYALHASLDSKVVDIVFILCAFIAMYAIDHALPHFGEKDPSHIVIDEFVGFAWLSCLLPVEPVLYIVGFFLFRFFDIVKPLGIKDIESYDGAWGIIFDDIYAATYAAVCMWIIGKVLGYAPFI